MGSGKGDIRSNGEMGLSLLSAFLLFLGMKG